MTVTHQIEIDERNYEALKEFADPFVDTTPNDVLTRVIEEYRRMLRERGGPPTTGDPGRRGRGSPAVRSARRAEEKTPQSEFREPLIRALRELGGSAPAGEAADKVHEIMGELKPGDYELVSGGQQRWRNATAWVRQQLKEEGVLRSDSPYGVWELASSHLTTEAEHEFDRTSDEQEETS